MRSGGSAGVVQMVLLTEDDWRSYRELRLEMLLDAPDAFWSTHAEVVERSEAEWRRSAGTGTLQARSADGRALGSVTVLPGEVLDADLAPGEVMLVAMYVRPDARGAGVGDALIRAAVRRAGQDLHGRRLVLHVSELNAPAIGLYQRHGFRPTGRTIAHPRQAGVRELELTRPV